MRKWVRFSMLLLGMIFLVGCAINAQAPKDPFLTGAYRSLSAMDTAYDVSWGGFVQLYKDGLVKEETFQLGKKLANDYFVKWTDAAIYLKKYSMGEVDQGGYDLLKGLADEALKAMKDYLKEKSGGLKPII